MRQSIKGQMSLSKGTIALAIIAIALLLISGIGSARAALVYYSETYAAQVELPDIGVTLVENGDDVATSNFNNDGNNYLDVSNNPEDARLGILTSKMIPEGEQLMLGRKYTEQLAVKNSGNIDQYVRVKLSKYWIKQNSETGENEKQTDLSPKLIDVEFATGGNGWVINKAQSSTERTVFYYTSILPVGQTTPAFTESITIDGLVASKVDETVSNRTEGGVEYTTITTTYDYNGVQFVLRAEVDAVQTHNAAAAIKSAWGVDVDIDPSSGAYRLK